MLARLDAPIGWGELLRRSFRDTQADDALGIAAQLAYYFFLALFPALLFLVALAGYVPAGDLTQRLMENARGVAPPAVIDIVRQQLQNISQRQSGGILTFGVAAAIWSSSVAMVALIGALNRAFDVEDTRSWVKQRFVAILLTIGSALFLVISLALVVAGPQVAEAIASRAGLGAAFVWTWKIAQWPVVLLLVITAVGLVYHFAPNVDQEWAWLTPGAILATVLWLAGSLAVRFYVVNFGSYEATYGAIGGVMVLMLWLYVSGLVVLLGAELNAEIAHASSPGADRHRARADDAPYRRARRGTATAGGSGRIEDGPGTPETAPFRPAATLARTGAIVAAAAAMLVGWRMRE